jgi:hypothetical protein
MLYIGWSVYGDAEPDGSHLSTVSRNASQTQWDDACLKPLTQLQNSALYRTYIMTLS